MGKTLELTEFLCFDIETTGFNSELDAILEIGAVKFSVKNGITDEFSSLIAFDGNISESVIAIHGITSKLIENAPSLDKVIDDFIKFIGSYPLLAHNAAFDTRFISSKLYRLNLPYPNNKIYDTIKILRRLMPNLESYKLDYLKSHFSVPFEKAHRALDDAKATSKVFSIAIKQNKGNHLIENIEKITKAIYFENF